MARKMQFNPQIAETIKLQIDLPKDIEPGTHELRVITTNGLSNPIIFQIGNLREVFEHTVNDTVADTADMQETTPLMLNGQIMPGDVDYFRFTAEKGQTLVCQVYARALVPYLADAVPGWFQAVLTLHDADGTELAYVDDFRIDPDPVLVFEVPKDGDYVLGIRDSIYRGRQDFVYRIAIGELPFIDHIFPLGGPKNSTVNIQLSGANLPYKTIKLETGPDAPAVRDVQIKRFNRVSNSRPFRVDEEPEMMEAEPNGLPSQAQPLPVGIVVNGRIAAPGDFDCFSFEGKKGDPVSLEVLARRLGSPLDARLILLDPEEHVLAISDDEVDRGAGLVTHHADAGLSWKLPKTGTYVVRLGDLQNKGGDAYGYRLRIGREQPDFRLRMVPSSLRIPQQGSALVTVHVLREGGFDGPVELSLKDAPDGVVLETAEVPADSDKAQLMISASAHAPQGIGPVTVEGIARLGARKTRSPAVPAEDMMQAFLWRHLVPSQELMAMVTETEPVSVTLKLPSKGAAIKARAGTIVRIPFEVERHLEYKGGIKLTLSDPPEWVSLKNKYIGSKKWLKGVLQININENADTGMTSTLVLNGQVRVAKKESDPDYNPVARWVNFKTYDFTIDAIPIEVID